MERHEILEAMSELKLYGMRASFETRLPARGWHDVTRSIRSSPV